MKNHKAVSEDLERLHIFVYVLDKDKNVIPAKTLGWAEYFENSKNRIVKQEDVGDCWVSTVFLGIDHAFPGLSELDQPDENYKPIVFETMIKKFPGSWLDYQTRYSTWEEAVAGHNKAVEWVKNGCKEDEL